MDIKNIGKLISESRKQSGYTQKQLADLLYVSDKAVSKWERGLSLPDYSLIPKLSMILNIDIEHLIPNSIFSKVSDWEGVLYINNKNGINEKTLIHNKPLIVYLISYFMLVGITKITILGCDEKFVKKLKLEKYGLSISFNKNAIKSKNKMIIYDNFFIFGANLTRIFRSFMDLEENVKVYFEKYELPVLFTHDKEIDIDSIRTTSVVKKLGRGMFVFNIKSIKKIKEAAQFVKINQSNSSFPISDLKEIAILRQLI